MSGGRGAVGRQEMGCPSTRSSQASFYSLLPSHTRLRDGVDPVGGQLHRERGHVVQNGPNFHLQQAEDGQSDTCTMRRAGAAAARWSPLSSHPRLHLLPLSPAPGPGEPPGPPAAPEEKRGMDGSALLCIVAVKATLAAASLSQQALHSTMHLRPADDVLESDVRLSHAPPAQVVAHVRRRQLKLPAGIASGVGEVQAVCTSGRAGPASGRRESVRCRFCCQQPGRTRSSGGRRPAPGAGLGA